MLIEREKRNALYRIIFIMMLYTVLLYERPLIAVFINAMHLLWAWLFTKTYREVSFSARISEISRKLKTNFIKYILYIMLILLIELVMFLSANDMLSFMTAVKILYFLLNGAHLSVSVALIITSSEDETSTLKTLPLNNPG